MHDDRHVNTNKHLFTFSLCLEPKKDNFDDEEYATLTTGYEPMYNAYDDAYDDVGYHEVIIGSIDYML